MPKRRRGNVEPKRRETPSDDPLDAFMTENAAKMKTMKEGVSIRRFDDA